MAISYSEESKFPLLDTGSGNSGAVFNGVLEQVDAGWEITLNAGEEIKAGDIVYLKSDGKMWQADGTDIAKMPVIGIAPNDVAISQDGKVRVRGWIDYDDTNRTAFAATRGNEIYPAAIVGDYAEITVTKPATFTQILGYCKTTTAANITRLVFDCLAMMDFRTFPRRISQSAQPANGAAANQISVGELILWHDTDDAKTYLVYNDTTVGVRKVELT